MTVFKKDSTPNFIVRKAKGLVGRSLYLPTEARHFQVQVDGRWYVFCLISKNGASSIRETIGAALEKSECSEGVSFESLFSNNLVRERSELDRADHIILFLRHPIDRVVSAFQNKFIQRKIARYQGSLLHDYEKTTNHDPDSATFEEFVFSYLSACFGKREKVRRGCDRHIFTQQQQVLPIDYDIVARVDQFDETMKSVGLEHLVPGRVNATRGTVDMLGAWAKPSEELYKIYRETGKTPSRSSLLNHDIMDRINYYYRSDIREFGSLFV